MKTHLSTLEFYLSHWDTLADFKDGSDKITLQELQVPSQTANLDKVYEKDIDSESLYVESKEFEDSEISQSPSSINLIVFFPFGLLIS